MAFDIDSISTKAVHNPPMMIVASKEKMGKTSFAAGDRVENGVIVEYGLNKPIILWLKGEQGADSIPVAKNKTAISSYEELMDALGWLAKEEHSFETVVIDSLTTFTELIKEKIMTEQPKDFPTDFSYMSFDNGPKAAVKYHREIINALTWLRDNKKMTVIVTVHIKSSPKTVNDPEKGSFDQWTADIANSTWNIYARSFDLICYADTKDIVNNVDVGMVKGQKQQGRVVSLNNGERFLFTKKTLAHPSGGRGMYGHLPSEIPFDWYSFQNAIAETIAKLNNNNNNKTNKENN